MGDSFSDANPGLPTSHDTLFKTAEDWWNNACLNYFHDGWATYAIGYRDAADVLVEHVLGRTHGRQNDTFIYPIFFLYRQYLELAIKDLICKGRKLIGDPSPYPKSHDILGLWKLCDRLMEQIFSDEAVEERKEIERMIGELARIDPFSTAFRYPEDKSGKPSLPGLSNINIRNIREVIAKISGILEGALIAIDECRSFMFDV